MIFLSQRRIITLYFHFTEGRILRKLPPASWLPPLHLTHLPAAQPAQFSSATFMQQATRWWSRTGFYPSKMLLRGWSMQRKETVHPAGGQNILLGNVSETRNTLCCWREAVFQCVLLNSPKAQWPLSCFQTQLLAGEVGSSESQSFDKLTEFIRCEASAHKYMTTHLKQSKNRCVWAPGWRPQLSMLTLHPKLL